MRTIEIQHGSLDRVAIDERAKQAMASAVEWSMDVVDRRDFGQWLDQALARGIIAATALVPAGDRPVLVLHAYLERVETSTPCLIVCLRSGGMIVAWTEGGLQPSHYATLVGAMDVRAVERHGALNSDEESVCVITDAGRWTFSLLLLGTEDRADGLVAAFVRSLGVA